MRKRRDFSKIKCGWHEVGGQRIYFRSNFELKYARHLQFLKDMNVIKNWEHEPQVFYFEGIKRGVTNYTPDFKVTNLDDSFYYVETKGFWDSKSITKVKRFRKYFPDLKLVCVNQRS